MKKIIALILALCIIGLSGCRTLSDIPAENVSDDESTVTEESSATVPSDLTESNDDSETVDVSDSTDASETTDTPTTTAVAETSTTKKATDNAPGTTVKQTERATVPYTTPTTKPSTTLHEEKPVVASLTPLAMKDYYGYQQLSKKGGDLLTAYLRIASAVEQMETDEVFIADLNLTADEAKLSYLYYRADFPQHFWLDSKYSLISSGNKPVNLKLYYNMTKAQRDSAQKNVRSVAVQILSGITTSMNTYQREKYIHDQLVKRIEYDTSFSKAHIHNLYGALVNKFAVCEGYSRAFQYLLYQAGIQCLFVSGTGTNLSGRTEKHAWNIAKIDGSYYFVDVTWDDPVSLNSSNKPICYAYFNGTTQQFSRDHKPDSDNYPLPACTATACNYFVREGTMVSTFNADQVASFIKKNKSVGEVHIYVNGNYSDYCAALSAAGSEILQKAGISSLNTIYIGQEIILLF